MMTNESLRKQRRKMFVAIMIIAIIFLLIIIWTLAPHVSKLMSIIFLMAFFTFLICQVIMRHIFKKLRSNWIFSLASATFVGLYFWMCHVLISDKLQPLEDEFYVTAIKECKLVYTSNGAHYDCGGKLDRIIKKRDSLIEENGFICIPCEWKIRGTNTTTLSAYLKLNPLR